MRCKLLLVAVSLAASLGVAGGLPRGLSWEEPAPGLSYGRIYYYLPDQLDLSSRPGLFIFMHGGGAECNSQPESYLKPDGKALRPAVDELPCITVAATAPHARNDHWRWNHPDAEKEILSIIEAVDAKVPIDHDRIFLGGQSMGGFGAYHLGQVLADRLAGVFAGAGAWCSADFRSMRGTPIFIHHGIYDCAPDFTNEELPRAQFQTGYSFALAAHELMTQYGVEHVFSPYAGGHGLKYPESQASLRRFVDWAKKHRRQPYAQTATVVTPCGADKPCMVRCMRSRWLEVTKFVPGTVELDTIELSEYGRAHTWDEFAAQTYRLNKKRFSGFRLEAFNRGENRFEVKAENVSEFRIYLAPQMGDLNRPFVIDAGVLGVKTSQAVRIEGEKDYIAVVDFVAEKKQPRSKRIVTVNPVSTGEVLDNPGMGIVVYRHDGNPWTYEPLTAPYDTLDWFPGVNVVCVRLPWRVLMPDDAMPRWDLIDTPVRAWKSKGRRFAIGITGESIPDAFIRRFAARYRGNRDLAFVQVDDTEDLGRWSVEFTGIPVISDGHGEPALYSQRIPGDTMLSLHWNRKELMDGIKRTHASYFGVRWFPETCHRNNEELYQDIARSIGYRFELREVRLPDVIEAGKPVRIETDWVNVGVAHCSIPAYITFSLLDNMGHVVWIWTDDAADLRTLDPESGDKGHVGTFSSRGSFGYVCEIPGDGDVVVENARRHFHLGTESTLKMLESGEYTLAVSVGELDGTPTISLPLAGGHDRLYPIGTVLVQDSGN